MAWETADNILNRAAKSLGLTPSTLPDPYGSENQIWVQLCVLLEELGQDLVREYDWSHLKKTHTFSTANGTAAYAFPADYARALNGTHWNRSTEWPLAGPVEEQAWQQLKATSTSLIRPVFRVVNDEFNIHPTPSSIETIAYEYISLYWVKETGQSAGNTQSADAYTDTLLFEPRLLVTGLKLRFKEAKGFDTTTAQRDYDAALTRALGADGPSAALSVTGGLTFRMLDDENVPETGYGT